MADQGVDESNLARALRLNSDLQNGRGGDPDEVIRALLGALQDAHAAAGRPLHDITAHDHPHEHHGIRHDHEHLHPVAELPFPVMSTHDKALLLQFATFEDRTAFKTWLLNTGWAAYSAQRR